MWILNQNPQNTPSKIYICQARSTEKSLSEDEGLSARWPFSWPLPLWTSSWSEVRSATVCGGDTAASWRSSEWLAATQPPPCARHRTSRPHLSAQEAENTGSKRAKMGKGIRWKSQFAYSHDSIQQATLLFGTLHSVHGPFVDGGGHPGVIKVQQPESRHVDPTVTVWLQIQSEQILPDKKKGNGNVRKVELTTQGLSIVSKITTFFSNSPKLWRKSDNILSSFPLMKAVKKLKIISFQIVQNLQPISK